MTKVVIFIPKLAYYNDLVQSQIDYNKQLSKGEPKITIEQLILARLKTAKIPKTTEVYAYDGELISVNLDVPNELYEKIEKCSKRSKAKGYKCFKKHLIVSLILKV